MIKNRLLITGSSGLIGTALGKFLQRRGVGIIGADIRAAPGEQKIDIRDTARLAPLLAGVTGIIHLAAVSRVVDGQRDPALCRAVNVDATRGILNAALASPHRPWVIYASSREVYGHQDVLPVGEDAAYGPLNIYARTKMNAELLVGQARDAGLQTSVVRFSTVYGSVADHADRVIPAFASAAMRGGVLRVDGGDCFLDPTHVDDVVVGLARIIDKLISGEKKLPAIHLVSGQRATLLELAELANEIGGNRATINFAPARSFDVHGFVGNPKRAETLLGWRTTTRLRDGLSRLMNEFADAQPVA